MGDMMHDTAEQEEKIILVGVATAENDDTEQSLDELEELGQTAGAVTLAKVIQNREKVHSATYIGKGKIQEVKELVEKYDADCVVCDDELTPAQYNNLQEEIGVKVIDRTSTASLSCFPLSRRQIRTFKTWRWYRNERSR